VTARRKDPEEDAISTPKERFTADPVMRKYPSPPGSKGDNVQGLLRAIPLNQVLNVLILAGSLQPGL